MHKRPGFPRAILSLVVTSLLLSVGPACLWLGGDALAEDRCPYQRLQVLLPGESPAPDTPSGKTGTPETQRVGVPFQILVRACNNSWETVTSVDHLMRITSSDATADLPPAQPMSQGELSVAVILNSTGSFTLGAEDLTDSHAPLGVSAAVTVIASCGDVVGLEFGTFAAEQEAGLPLLVTLQAVDAEGRRVESYHEAVNLTQLTSQGQGRLSPATVTLEDGAWTGDLTLYLADTGDDECSDGNVRIEAVQASEPGIDGLSQCFRVAPGPFSRMHVLAPGETLRPGQIEALDGLPNPQAAGVGFTARAIATDAYWNRVDVSGSYVISSSDPAASTPVTGAIAAGLGESHIVLNSTGWQTLTLEAVVMGCAVPPVIGSAIPVISSEPDFEIAGIPSPLTAGVPFTAAIRVMRPDGETMTEFNGYAVLVTSAGPGTVSPDQILFDAGEWAGQVTVYGTGDAVALSCLDYSLPPNLATSNAVLVLPGEFAGLQIVLPGEEPQCGLGAGLTGTPLNQQAGQDFAVTVRAVDNWWNRVPELFDPLEIACTDHYADLPDSPALVEGELALPLTLLAAGMHTIQVRDMERGDIAACQSTGFRVEPGPYAQIMMLAPGEERIPGLTEGKAGRATDQSVNHLFDVDIVATDAWWNRVGGVNDELELRCTDPLAEIPAGLHLNEGAATLGVRFATGGYQLLEAQSLSREDIPSTESQIRVINSGFHYEVEVHPEQVAAGEPFTLTVRVTNDASAVMQEVNAIVQVRVVSADTGIPGEGSLLLKQFQLQQGQRTITQSYTRAEAIFLRVGDGGEHRPGVSNRIRIVPGPPAEMRLGCDPPWVGGRASTTVTARVLDEHANGVPGQPVHFEVFEGQGTIAAIDAETDASGSARATYTGAYDPEMGWIRTVSGDFATELRIQTALVDPQAADGSITNYPNPFHPDERMTTIAYRLSDDARVRYRIYTLSGGLVIDRHINEGDQGGNAGLNEIQWNGRNGEGQLVASGGYLLLVEAQRAGETIHSMRRRIGVVR